MHRCGLLLLAQVNGGFFYTIIIRLVFVVTLVFITISTFRAYVLDTHLIIWAVCVHVDE